MREIPAGGKLKVGVEQWGEKRVCHRDGKRVEVADRCDGFRCIDFPRDNRPSMLPKTEKSEKSKKH